MEETKPVIITNNPQVKLEFSDKGYEIRFVSSTLEVLTQARDLIHKSYALINHTMTGNIPIYKHPYRTLALKPGISLHTESLMLIESSLEKLKIGKLPNYKESVIKDFQDLDLTIFKEVKLY